MVLKESLSGRKALGAMPNGVPALARFRERGIADLERFIQIECGGMRLPESAAKQAWEESIASWELQVQVEERVRRLQLHIDRSFPFSAPHFLLVDRPEFLVWPHVEKNGKLCVLNEYSTVDATNPAEVARRLLTNEVYPLIQACQAGLNSGDLRAEFYSYWNPTVHAGALRVRSLLRPVGPSRRICVWRGQQFSLAGEDAKTIFEWLQNMFAKFDKQNTSTNEACLLWLDKPLSPIEYPKCAADVWTIATNTPEGTNVLSGIVPQESKPIDIIFGATGENGPCFCGVTARWPTCTDSRGKRHYRVSNGFRPGHIPQQELARRVFMTSEKISRARVDRVDSAWIHGRDQDPGQKVLSATRIAIVGCGSVGAAVASQLARAGVGEILLIDNDEMEWANVGRHVLGANNVGRNKASELEALLKITFPHSKFESRGLDIEDVVANEPGCLNNCQAILCATADRVAESVINTWHVVEGKPPFVVFAWTEPYACAGHAVAIKKGISCFQCQVSDFGNPHHAVTCWPDSQNMRQEPGCGAVYQPYGPVEITWTTCLVSSLVLDCLLGKISDSTHRIWAGPTSLLKEAGGSWSPEWIEKRPDRAGGGFLEECLWLRDPTCLVCS